MSKTALSIRGERFYIHGTPVYAEIAGADPSLHGLLLNARFIQGVFDDASSPERFARFGHAAWDPEKNTDNLIAALPEWRDYGLRAFTVGFQGGGPCFTTDNNAIDNNPFGDDGANLDPAYAARMDRLIRAADDLGMAVIVSLFYHAQAKRIQDGRGIRNAVITASRFLREGGYQNVIIEIANEHEVLDFRYHPIIREEEGMALLLDIARRESGGMPVGCSGGGGTIERQIAQASDVVLIHGNGLSRQHYYALVQRARAAAPGKPVVCNEDSQAVGQLQVAFRTQSSWGYYNNMTKQEPPADWGVTRGEDRFFAIRMARGLGIPVDIPPFEDQFYLQGLESNITLGHQRWIRLASLYPEQIDRVDFYRNGTLIDTCFDEPFSLKWRMNWLQDAVELFPGDEIRAVIHMVDGTAIERRGVA